MMYYNIIVCNCEKNKSNNSSLWGAKFLFQNLFATAHVMSGEDCVKNRADHFTAIYFSNILATNCSNSDASSV